MKTLVLLFLTVVTCSVIEGQGYKIGDVAADFNLKNVDGNFVSLSDYKDAKGFIVVFTCNHCPTAVAYQDRIIEIDRKYEPQGYPVIAINPNDNPMYPEDSYEGMKERAKEKGFTFPYLFDAGQKIYPKYGATKTPHVYLLNREKKGLVVKYIGAIDNNSMDAKAVTNKFLENAVNSLLEGKEPNPAVTKAIGCSIKPAG